MNANVKKWILIIGVPVGMLLTLIMIVFGSYVSAYNTGNRLEKSIKAQWTDNTNILSKYHTKIEEAVQVPAMYKDDFKEVVVGALEGRYGKKGSQATFQWIKEHDIKFDSSLYTKIQQMIESGRNEFANEQSKLIDKKRVYETKLGTLWGGTWLSIAGYPKVDLKDFNIVVAKSASEVFDTGEDKALKLR